VSAFHSTLGIVIGQVELQGQGSTASLGRKATIVCTASANITAKEDIGVTIHPMLVVQYGPEKGEVYRVGRPVATVISALILQ
jgi:hypothetical protein